MTRAEIYGLLRHELEAHAQLLALLERQDAIEAAVPKAPEQQPEIVPHAAEESGNLSAVLRKASTGTRNWLRDSGIDTIPRFRAFLLGATPENIEAIKSLAQQEGY